MDEAVVVIDKQKLHTRTGTFTGFWGGLLPGWRFADGAEEAGGLHSSFVFLALGVRVIEQRRAHRVFRDSVP